jgi:hypothetical protein
MNTPKIITSSLLLLLALFGCTSTPPNMHVTVAPVCPWWKPLFGKEAKKHSEENKTSIQKQTADVEAIEILQLQQKYNLVEGELVPIVDESEENANDFVRLSKLYSELHLWNKEGNILVPESEHEVVKNLVRNSSSYPIMQVEFLKNNRALVTTGKIEEKNDSLIVSEGNGEHFFLLKYNNKWKIIYISEWESVTVQ